MQLPAGVYLRYGGAAETQTEAAHELLLHSAAAFVLIVLLLGLAFGHVRHVLLVLLALPSTLIGGVAAVALTGGTLTLGAMVGFVALFGMAARNTILLVSHYDHLVREEGQTWSLATALRGAEERLTPVLLTALLTALALLPVALQLKQPGHEIEGPMAVVILGGLVSSTLVSLLLIPPLAARWLRPGESSRVFVCQRGMLNLRLRRSRHPIRADARPRSIAKISRRGRRDPARCTAARRMDSRPASRNIFAPASRGRVRYDASISTTCTMTECVDVCAASGSAGPSTTTIDPPPNVIWMR